MKKKKLVTSILAASLVSTGTVLSGGALAQGPALEEVVVTARKREELLQNVPVAITAVTAETLENAGITEFSEISMVTPGFSTYASSSNETALALTLRGQVQSDVLITLDPSVGVYMDGLYVARAYGLNSDLMDIQNVQLIKGPQGTLFGRNSTGGALLLQTSDPELETFTGSISGTGGGDITGYQGVLNVPLGEKFAFRVAHRSSERDDYIDNVVTGKKVGGQETEASRVKFRFAPTDELDFVLAYDKFDYDSARSARNVLWLDTGRVTAAGGLSDLGRFDEDDDKVANNFDPQTAAETETIYLVAKYEAPFGELKVTAGHREVETAVHFDLDGTAAGVHGTHGAAEMEQDSIELQLTTSLFNDRLDLVVGGLYFKEDAMASDFTSGTTGPGVPALGISAVYWGDQEVESIGLYTQGTFEINDVSNLTLGIRYSEDDKRLIQRAGYSSASPYDSVKTMGANIVDPRPAIAAPCLNGADPAELCQRVLKSSDDAISWTIGYDYRLADGMLLYAKVSEGYRSGGFNIRTSGGGEVPFEPEFTTEYELGLKADLFDRRVRWNSAIYHSTTDDKQVTTFVSASATQSTTVILNAAETEVTGFETELTMQLTDSWMLTASYAYTDAEYKSYTDAAGIERDPTPRLWYIPENEYSLSLNYREELPFAIVSFNAIYHWIDEMDATDAPSYTPAPGGLTTEAAFLDASKTDDYGTLNLRLTLSTKDEKYSASIWGNNVLDERAITNSLSLITANYNYVSGFYNDPATYGITLAAKF